MEAIIAEINEKSKMLGKRAAWTILAASVLIIMGIMYMPFFIGGIVLLIYSFKNQASEREKLNLHIKSTVITHYLKNSFQNVTYEPTKGMDAELVRSTGLFRMGNLYGSNDLIHAVYKDIAFTHADVSIRDEDKSDKNTRITELFEGKIFYFDFPKKTDVYLQIRKKGKEQIKHSKQSWKDTEIVKIQMENEEFNQKYTVYSNSQQEAFYVLTPQVMESIKRLDEIVKVGFVLGIINNRLYVGLNTSEDVFELDATAKFDLDKIEKDMSRLVSYVECIGDMILKSKL